MTTEWRIVPCDADYRISTDGRLESKKRGDWKPMKAWEDPEDGYSHVALSGRSKLIHRLVAEAFIPNPDDLPCVRHLDGDPTNAHVSNLAWGTYWENEQDKLTHGTFHRRGGTRKLSEDDRAYIRAAWVSGASTKALASRFGVHIRTIQRLIVGRSWAEDSSQRPAA